MRACKGMTDQFLLFNDKRRWRHLRTLLLDNICTKYIAHMMKLALTHQWLGFETERRAVCINFLASRPSGGQPPHPKQSETQQQQQAGHTVEIVHGGRRRRCGQCGGNGCSFVRAPLLGPDCCSGRIRNDNLAGAKNLCSVMGAAPCVIDNRESH